MSIPFQYAAFARRLHHLVEAGQQKAARRGLSMLVSATADIAPVVPALLFGQAQGQERILWEQASREFAMVAVGATARLTGHGKSRFLQISAGWRELLSRTRVDSIPSCPLPTPVSLGGFAFDPARQAGPNWRDFPDALLVIPRFLFIACEGSSWLTVNVMVTPTCDVQAVVHTAVSALQELLKADETQAGEERCGSVAVLQDAAQAARWQETVATIGQEIERGTVEKLVLAREVHVHSPQLISPAAVMNRLRGGYGRCTLFAFAGKQTCFVGATPERLVRLKGKTVQTDCLAGSTRRGATHTEDRSLGEALLANHKERHEHALVVRTLQNALRPFCLSLNAPETPTLLCMPNIQHLHTPLEGVLKEESDIFGLVEKLHPTPATGGLPREIACSLLRRYECFDRGWYAGPVGWVDGRGGGEFVVAIRSALLRDREASLYAGCGIVAGSDPEREYEESCLKLRPMLWAMNGKQT